MLCRSTTSCMEYTATTADVFAEDIKGAMDSGMNAHLSKPVDMGVLEQTVKAVPEGKTCHEIST